ncbi:MAG: hypothetical protein MJE66_11295 [Proteobacteria bacterium]|nr:hypothetical protein [Pseudomonadota bacterium]
MNDWRRSWGIALVVLLTACPRPDAKVEPQCVADEVGKLDPVVGRLPDCAADGLVCREACQAGNAAACLSRAYALQSDPSAQAETVGLYRRACVLGSANGCTNFAAHVWLREEAEERQACARRTFARVCEVGEHFACGMVGRVLFDQADSPEEYLEGRKYLEAACKEPGGFACRVLAVQLESGQLGAYEPERIGELLRRACESGDTDSCGEPATASETFH